MQNIKSFLLLSFATISGITWQQGLTAQPLPDQPFRAEPVTEYPALPAKETLMVKATSWADSVMNLLNTEQRIAQLMMVRTYSNRNDDFNNSIDQLITRYGIGGLCFFQGTAERQKELTKYWQECSQVPLFIAMDAENGPGMRLTGAFSFPDFMTMGALTNDTLIRLAGYRTGQMCSSLGVHINFSPVADVNNNPLNPVIHMRSFGENTWKVADKASAFAQGLQDAGIIATAKHFPGHGDTDSDSHFSLPVLQKTESQLDSTELIPFKRLIRSGTGAVMVGHLTLPLLDTNRNLAATFSRPIVEKLLKQKLGFNGLVITDGLDMKGATLHFGPGEPSLRALIAGSDILLLPADIPTAIETIKKALADSIITEETINSHCRKVLSAKYLNIIAAGQLKPVSRSADPSGEAYDKALNRTILKESAVLVTNRYNLIPLQRPDTMKIAVVTCGLPGDNSFSEMINAYAPADLFALPSENNETIIGTLKDQLAGYDLIIISVISKNQGAAKDYGIAPGTSQLHQRLVESGKNTLVVLFGSPYGAGRIAGISQAAGVIVTADNSPASLELVPQMMFGALPFRGKLPVSIDGLAGAGTGLQTKSNGRLQYVIPEELGIDPLQLATIDSIAQAGIDTGAYPGCQIEFALRGKVFYRKAFGNKEPGVPSPVRLTDIYDLASLTKVLATTAAVMKLTDEHKLDIRRRLSLYLPMLQKSNKGKLLIVDIMTHQAGLQPWIPFYQNTLADRNRYYSDSLSKEYSLKVADNLFLRTDYRDTIFDLILSSPLNPAQGYKYSDLGFILLKEAIEEITEMPFDRWVETNFYEPLSTNQMGFKPWTRVSPNRIAPTENDLIWRKQLLRGYVHDQAAAMLGGVSGHAGLFGNSNDVTIMMQMFLNKGFYGGIQFISEKTIEEFTRQPQNNHSNRRAPGFDKQPLQKTKDGPVCEEASEKSYGHSGFTGTYTWADPENGLVYTFLSNRVCPDATNNKLSHLNIRTRIHSAAYQAIKPAVAPNFSSYPDGSSPSVLLINISKLGLLINTCL